ncbi:MAG: hypothetical protein GY884_30020, partial [Proteobacteria bacterium]|nr:hypothetical protein [Pseudomonadota bacterium]
MLLLLGSLVSAAPDRVAWSSSEGTALDALSVSTAGVAAFVDDGSDSLVVLDTETWETSFAQVCTGALVTALDTVTADDAVTVYAGCEDGSLVPVEFKPGYGLAVGETISVA